MLCPLYLHLLPRAGKESLMYVMLVTTTSNMTKTHDLHDHCTVYSHRTFLTYLLPEKNRSVSCYDPATGLSDYTFVAES